MPSPLVDYRSSLMLLGMVWLPQYSSLDGVTVLEDISKCQKCIMSSEAALIDVFVVARRWLDTVCT
jgi:hypothetical protein